VPLAIQCRKLQHRYPGKPPVEAVRGIDLEVRAGECFGLLGPNGAGKTTTIEIIEGLIAPTDGTVEVLGLRWSEQPNAIKERMGISLQETRLADKLTVLETLTLFRSFYRTGLDPEEALARVALTDKAQSWVVKLSGGQRQRLAVACALVGDPDLLCLDEPTTGLDPQARRQLWEVIHGFRQTGRTVLLTTHYMDEAERLCDRVAVVDHGKIIALGTPAELVAALGGAHVVELALHKAPDAPPLAVEALTELPAVRTARVVRDQLHLTVSELHLALPALLAHLADRGIALAALRTRQATLEDVFIELTGRGLREDEAPK